MYATNQKIQVFTCLDLLLIIFNACRDAKIYRYTRIVHVHSNYPTLNLGKKKKKSNSEMCIRVKETSRSVNGLYPIFWTMLNKQSFLKKKNTKISLAWWARFWFESKSWYNPICLRVKLFTNQLFSYTPTNESYCLVFFCLVYLFASW